MCILNGKTMYFFICLCTSRNAQNLVWPLPQWPDVPRSIHSPRGGHHLLFPDGASMLEPHESKDRPEKGPGRESIGELMSGEQLQLWVIGT